MERDFRADAQFFVHRSRAQAPLLDSDFSMIAVTPRVSEETYLLLQLIAVGFAALTLLCPMFVGKRAEALAWEPQILNAPNVDHCLSDACLRLEGYQAKCGWMEPMGGEPFRVLLGDYAFEVEDFGYGCLARDSSAVRSLWLFVAGLCAALASLVSVGFRLHCCDVTRGLSLLATVLLGGVVVMECVLFAVPMCGPTEDHYERDGTPNYALADLFDLGSGFLSLSVAFASQVLATLFIVGRRSKRARSSVSFMEEEKKGAAPVMGWREGNV